MSLGGTTKSAFPLLITASGSAEYAQLSGVCTITNPPELTIAAAPCTPSSPFPERMIAIDLALLGWEATYRSDDLSHRIFQPETKYHSIIKGYGSEYDAFLNIELSKNTFRGAKAPLEPPITIMFVPACKFYYLKGCFEFFSTSITLSEEGKKEGKKVGKK